MSALDLAWVRAQFPALAQTVNGQPAVFFDGPGGTQVPRRVIEAMADYLARSNANTHGAFATSRRTDETIAAAHAAMADFLGCDPDEVIFGPNMTTLTFMLSRSIGREIRPGDEIVLTRLDHDANYSPWKALEERGAVIKVADVDVEDCTLDMDDLRRQITPRTRLVAVGYASNAVGTVNDVAEVVRLAREVGALSFVDAVHYAPHGPLDVRALGCDFLACSPYKFFAPHAGTLYGKREHLLRLHPYKVRPATDELPGRWMTGTQSHEAMAGVTAAVEYLAELGRAVAGQPRQTTPRSAGGVGHEAQPDDSEAREAQYDLSEVRPSPSRRQELLAAMEAIGAYERGLSEQLVGGLLEIPGLTFYGIREPERFDRRTPTVAVRLAGYTPRELVEALAERGIFAWDGNYYALNLTERLGVEQDGGMLRIGLVHYNTGDEIGRLLAAMGELAAAR
ncbi:MAG TPA: cysteine desulfurase-like protein [Chloroflexaceae bacterium]|nr:cysteine desulfurase-like protein [Chloroflexaceae bacterium]